MSHGVTVGIGSNGNGNTTVKCVCGRALSLTTLRELTALPQTTELDQWRTMR